METRPIGWFEGLRIRLVGGSLLRRTVVSVAAFTMSTCLLLGLVSMAAVGVTRAVTGDAPPVDDTVAAADADASGEDGAADDEGAAPAKGKKASAKTAKKSTRRAPGARTGGAIAPDQALGGSKRGGS